VKPRRQFILFYFRLTPIHIVKTVKIVDDRHEVYTIRAVISVGHHIFYCSPCPVCSDVILLVERLRRYPDLNTNNLGELVANSRSIRTRSTSATVFLGMYISTSLPRKLLSHWISSGGISAAVQHTSENSATKPWWDRNSNTPHQCGTTPSNAMSSPQSCANVIPYTERTCRYFSFNLSANQLHPHQKVWNQVMTDTVQHYCVQPNLLFKCSPTLEHFASWDSFKATLLHCVSKSSHL